MSNKENTNTVEINSFSDLGIKESILKVIADLGLSCPTPIQRQAIPAALEGEDIVGIAQTGTGKTFAFGIPMLQRLALVKGRGLVLLPTRELAGQVENSLKALGTPLGLRTVSLIGGEAIGRQLFGLRRNPHILVATPGRLIDHLKRGTVHLDNISVLVLDEADMMFDMGFAPQIEEVMKTVPAERQTLLFSATMPVAVMKLAEKHLHTPVRIEVAPSGTTAELVEQEILILSRDQRYDEMISLLADYQSSVLVFVRTKHGASKLTKKLREDGYKAAEIHSNLSFSQRQASLAGFRSGQFRILVATDVAARGLDINDIELVLNFDLPDNSEDYVHRIGRTARAGKRGKAISFAMPDQRREVMKIEQLIRQTLPIRKINGTVGNTVRFGTRGRKYSPVAPITDVTEEKAVKKFVHERRNDPTRQNKPFSRQTRSRQGLNKFSPKVKPASSKLVEARESSETERYSSLGFRKRAEKVDVTALPDYLQPSSNRHSVSSHRSSAARPSSTAKRPYRADSQGGRRNSGQPVAPMVNPEFDGGNRFAFRRKMYNLKQEAKGHAVTHGAAVHSYRKQA